MAKLTYLEGQNLFIFFTLQGENSFALQILFPPLELLTNNARYLMYAKSQKAIWKKI
jgi:hypothetical protein